MTLQEARESVGWNRAELARQAGMKDGDIYDLEAGRVRRPSWDSVYRITEAFRRAGMKGLTPEQIFPLQGSIPDQLAGEGGEGAGTPGVGAGVDAPSEVAPAVSAVKCVDQPSEAMASSASGEDVVDAERRRDDRRGRKSSAHGDESSAAGDAAGSSNRLETSERVA